MTNTITSQEVKSDIKKYFIIDVREADEHAQGTIAGALCVPLGRLIRDLPLLNIPEDKEVVCYCRSGFRAQIATDLLNAQGYNAKNLVGGYKAYMSS